VTLSEYVDAIRRGWIVVVAAVVLALAAGAASVTRQADVYASSTELFVAPASSDGNPDLLAQRAAVAANRVKSYVPVVSGDLVRNQVDEAVGGIGDAGVSVVVPLDTVVLSISVTSADPEHAADVAAAYADVASDVIEEIETPDDASSTVKVTTVDAADVPSAPLGRSVVPVFGAAGILGLGLGLTIAVLRDVLRRERAQRRTAAPQGKAA
jgi:capsular polysaccharide biosynthesis protein